MVADFFLNHPFLSLLGGIVLSVAYVYVIIFEMKEGDDDGDI